MPDRTFRLPLLICCDICSKEYFGIWGEKEAREHARKTGHQVRIHLLVRETLHEVAPGVIPEYETPAGISGRERKLSRDAAIARLAAIYGGAS